MLFRRCSGWLLVASLSAFLAGCSNDQPSTPPQETGDFNLGDDFGGYKATAEEPGFGDPDMVLMAGDEPADDETFTASALDSLWNLSAVDVYALELLWGHLQFDSAETDITDWSGTLTIERGGIIALRRIGFERGDHLVRPRHNHRVLEWNSHTGPSFDGILVYIYDPDPDSFASENSVSFSTAPYSRVFTISELQSISEVVDVGDNQVSLDGFKVERLPCEAGYFDGKWTRSGQQGDRGRFHGRWMSSDGLLFGHLQGHFGIREDGSHVLFGKWITVSGAFRCLIKGTWGIDPESESEKSGSGWLAGQAYDSAGNILGEFSGEWVAAITGNSAGDGDDRKGYDDNRPPGRGHGFFRGQWSEICQ